MNGSGVRLVLLGKPGAGKGTQAALLSAHYGVEHLSTGDVFRAAVAQGTSTGLEVKRFLDTGRARPRRHRHPRRRRALRRRRSARGRLHPRRLPAHAGAGRGARAGPHRPPARPRAQHRGAHRDRSSTASPVAGCASTAAPRTTSTSRPEGRLDVRRVRRRRRAARRRHRGGGRQPARGLRAPDRADHRLLLQPREAGRGRRRRRRRRGAGAPDQGDRRALRARSELDHPQERRAARADAARGRGGRRDARGLHPGRGAGCDARSTSTQWRAR